jgi:molybdate transport system substrate-binding protein
MLAFVFHPVILLVETIPSLYTRGYGEWNSRALYRRMRNRYRSAGTTAANLSMTLTRRSLIYGLPLITLATRSRAADQAQVQIYAAMTFRPALERVLAAYQHTGGSAIAVYAPTPVLVRQLAGGAPADILLTADPMWMDEAARQGLIQPDTRSNLMANDLVLAASVGTPVTGTIMPNFKLAELLNGGRLAMCDPEHDPAGRYAKQSLQALGFWQAVEPHIAIAESSPGAVVLLDHGEVRAAICFKTDLHGDAHAIVIGTFPATSHAPIVYPVALTHTPPSPQAQDALAFLRSAYARKIFDEFGYAPAG